MKKSILFIFAMILLSIQSNKKSLLCHRWVQFGSKPEINAPLTIIDTLSSEHVNFNSDGTYEKSVYHGKIKMTGNWYLNDDETKMEFTLTSFNGNTVPPFPETSRHYNIIIIKLTTDTLIYGNEYYRGKEGGKMSYNHSDSYLVRQP